jgi:hydrogenase maturation protease
MLIIGIGNAYRRDDGVGLAVAQQLKHLPEFTVIEQSGEGAALMEAWKGAGMVIVIDAAASGAKPGMIYRLDASMQPIPARFFSYSTHEFSLAEAVEMARILGELPSHLIIYAIEGENFSHGLELSPAVEAAIPEVVRAVMRDASNFLSPQ